MCKNLNSTLCLSSMKDLDCYFFTDITIPLERRGMSVLCVDCHAKEMPDSGWFYEGSKEGYGPFDFQCCKCSKFVHKAEKDDEQEQP